MSIKYLVTKWIQKTEKEKKNSTGREKRTEKSGLREGEIDTIKVDEEHNVSHK